jgi:hypothetical protein
VPQLLQVAHWGPQQHLPAMCSPAAPAGGRELKVQLLPIAGLPLLTIGLSPRLQQSESAVVRVFRISLSV